mgnify:CR=1 FL=1
MSEKKRVFSGMRPTGQLHLGHYFGVIANWLDLQAEFNCFFSVVDWHAMTTEYADPWKVQKMVPGLVRDWVSSGIDPEKCVIFQQSAVKEHAELSLLLSMITPLGWLERCPTYKEQREQLAAKDINTMGFLGYPVLMAADILLYFAHAVPVGQDQLPHLELAREIARRFNHLYETDLLIEPQDLLTAEAKLPGLDGRKMSKSYGNAIALSDPIEDILPKVRSMLTDKNRLRKSDPGDPSICNLFPYHKLLTDPAKLPEIEEGCRNASWGCVDCKKVLMESLEAFLTPMQERRAKIDDDTVRDILADGNKRAREFAQRSMAQIRDAIGYDI